MSSYEQNGADLDLALEAEYRRRLGRKSIEAFAKRVEPTFVVHPHTRRILDLLELLATSDVDRAMIFIPPQHGKSFLGSQIFPAYVAGQRRTAIILASYAAERAVDFSRKARNLVSSPMYPFAARIAKDSFAADRWRMDNGSELRAAGIGGGITGFGANLLVIDDPVADREHADSIAERDKAWTWYQDVARTRLRAGAKQLLIMTRWHDDDLAGRMLNTPAADLWSILSLPAIAPDGAELWPESLGGPKLPRIDLGEISSRSWEALYQQNPLPAEGNVFKAAWFNNRYTTPPRFTRTVMGLDGAWKVGVTNDRSAAVIWGTDGVNYYVVDAWAERLEYPDLKRKLVDYYNRMRPNAVAVEDAASGTALIQELRRSTDMPIIAVPAKGDKVTRAEATTPLWESGKVILPEQAPWADEFTTEHLRFPAGVHDDYVDAAAHGLTHISKPGFYFTKSSR